jgi:hypothetical protein
MFRGHKLACLLLLHFWHGENTANGTNTVNALAEMFRSTGGISAKSSLTPSRRACHRSWKGVLVSCAIRLVGCTALSSYQARYCTRVSSCSKEAVLERLKLTCPDQEKHPRSVNLGGAILLRQYLDFLGPKQCQTYSSFIASLRTMSLRIFAPVPGAMAVT